MCVWIVNEKLITFPCEPDGAYILWGDSGARKVDVAHYIVCPSYRCNLKCRHCYNPEEDRDYVMPLEDLKFFVDGWAEKGGGIFHLKGGEPFMLPYFWEILNYVASFGTFHVMITTNGTFNHEETLDKLKVFCDKLNRKFTIIVSLDGPDAETDAFLRGTGHFKRAVDFIKGLKYRKIPFQINCVIHRRNLSLAGEFLDFVEREFGNCQVNFIRMLVRGRATNIADWEVPQEEFDSMLYALYEVFPHLLVGSLPDVEKRTGYKNFGRCVAGFSGICYVTPSGEVWACPNRKTGISMDYVGDHISLCHCRNF